MRSRCLVALTVALALVAAACGDDDTTAEDGTTTSTTATAAAPESTTTEPPVDPTTTEQGDVELTASFRGVTEDAIKVGIIALDWDRLAALGVKFGFSNSGDLTEAAIQAINDRGGVYGRMIETHLITILPVGSEESDAACVELTADIEVFVVMGTVLGDDVLCYTEANETAALLSTGMTEERARRAKAPYATLVGDVDTRAARFVAAMEDLGVLDDAVLGVQGSVDVSETNFDAVIDAFGDAGHEVVPGLLGDNDDDLAETARQQDLIYERFVENGVNTTVSTTGVPLAMANAVAAGYATDQWLLYTTMSGTGLRDAGVDPMYLDGAYGVANTLTQTAALADMADDPLVRDCVDDLVARTGHEVYFDLDAEVNDILTALYSCGGAMVLEAALWNAGPNLTNETFQDGLEAIGEIEIPALSDVRFEPGHLGGADGVIVVRFDGSTATWIPVE